MAGFTEGALVKKLMDLNPSQQSIQTLSLWLIHHRKHHPTIVKVWFKEMCKVKDNRKLMFMYLANDVIQNSKKKGPEFGKEFATVLPRAFEHMKSFDEKTRERLSRLLQIWEERGVYDKTQIADFKASFNSASDPVKESVTPPPRKKPRIDVEKQKEKEREREREREKEKEKEREREKDKEREKEKEKEKKERKKSETEIEIDGTKELHVTLSPRTPAGDPPETEELVKALMVNNVPSFYEQVKDYVPTPIKYLEMQKNGVQSMGRKRKYTCNGKNKIPIAYVHPRTRTIAELMAMDLENTASSDASVRERIASLPPEVSEVSLLANLADRSAADQLSVAVNEAAALLADYNGRLQAEMEDRRRLLTMLRDYTLAQKQLLQQAQTTLEDYKEKLKKICAVRTEVKSHISNLPDLTQLPDVTGGLAPLPSAGDLFSLH